MGEFSAWHLLILAGVFVLLFGARRLPDGARALGRSLRIFKTEVKGLHDDEPATPPTTATATPSTPAGALPAPAPTPVPPADQQVHQAASAPDRDAR
jgi:sec-independent protein translocase protein TatA